MQGEVLDDDLDKEDDDDDNDNNDDDGHFGMEYNVTVYDGRETLLLLSIKPDYQLVRAVLMSLQV